MKTLIITLALWLFTFAASAQTDPVTITSSYVSLGIKDKAGDYNYGKRTIKHIDITVGATEVIIHAKVKHTVTLGRNLADEVRNDDNTGEYSRWDAHDEIGKKCRFRIDSYDDGFLTVAVLYDDVSFAYMFDPTEDEEPLSKALE